MPFAERQRIEQEIVDVHNRAVYDFCTFWRSSETEKILAEPDRTAAQTDYSRNEVINLILAHGVRNIEIE